MGDLKAAGGKRKYHVVPYHVDPLGRMRVRKGNLAITIPPDGLQATGRELYLHSIGDSPHGFVRDVLVRRTLTVGKSVLLEETDNSRGLVYKPVAILNPVSKMGRYMVFLSVPLLALTFLATYMLFVAVSVFLAGLVVIFSGRDNLHFDYKGIPSYADPEKFIEDEHLRVYNPKFNKEALWSL